VGGAQLLAGVQLASRVLTFALNVALARTMSDPSALGVAAVQLYLLDTLVLTLAREGVRRTGLRVAEEGTKGHLGASRDLLNLAWWGVGAGLVLTVPFCLYFGWSVDPVALGGVDEREYRHAVGVMGVAIVLELLSEPLFVAAQAQLEYRARSLIEGLAVFFRCVVQFLGVMAFNLNLIAFAYGYVAYAGCLLACYVVFFLRRGVDLIELMPSDGFRIADRNLVTLASDLSFQQVWKLLLQEGEKMVMMTFRMAATDQAIYSLVFNLGSLVVRFVFLPVEESAYATYGKLNDIAQRQGSSGKTEISLLSLVAVMTRVMSLIGMVFVTFGPSYSHLLLHLLYGNKWSNEFEAAPTLGVYCMFVGVVAVNGITEAFVHAVGDQADVRMFNGWLFLFSAVHLGTSVALFDLGAIGLILANCISMSLRIVVSVRFISTWQDPSNHARLGSFMSLFPRIGTLVAFFVVRQVVIASEAHLYRQFASWFAAAAHVAVGGACLLGLALTSVVLLERDLVQQVSALRRVLASAPKTA